METERIQPLREDAQSTLKRWSYAAEECAQQVSVKRYYSTGYHTHRWRHIELYSTTLSVVRTIFH